MAFQPGQTAGDYQILQVLGAGGMGKVYKVRNTISDRVEAMKVLLPDLDGDPELADRFLREIKVQAQLVHPNIAALHTALRVDNQLLMLMEFVEGQNIESMIEAGPLPAGKAVEYTAKVLEALEFAHQHGVVHRDIKPANIMVNSQGVVKLMDFGIARMANQRLTKTGHTVGSLFYMSPEQIEGAATIDGRADLYSLGITLYQMVTARLPFQGDSDYAIMAAHLTGSPVPPIEIDPRLPPQLNAAILMSLAKDPNRRFQSAAAFRNAILGSLQATAVQTPAVQTTAIAPTAQRPVAPAPPPTAALRTPPPTVPMQVPTPPRPAPSGGSRGIVLALASVLALGAVVVGVVKGPEWFRPSPVGEKKTEPVKTVNAPDPGRESAVGKVGAGEKTPPKGTPVEPAKPLEKTAGRETPKAPVTAYSQLPPADPKNTAVQLPRTDPYGQPPANLASQANLANQANQASQANAEELRGLQDRWNQTMLRAKAVHTAIANLERSMGPGLSANARLTSGRDRAEFQLGQAGHAIQAGDAAGARKALDAADRDLGQLEEHFNLR